MCLRQVRPIAAGLFVVFDVVGFVEWWERCFEVDLVGVHPHLGGPCAFVVSEALYGCAVGEVVQACLHGLGAFCCEGLGGFYGGADDGDVAGDVSVRVDEDQNDKHALIGELLGLERGAYGPPAVMAASFAVEPAALGAGEEVCAVLRGTQHIDSEALPGCGGECAAMGVAVAGTGFAGTPMDLAVGQPKVFDVHAFENLQHVLSGRGDGAAAAGIGWRDCGGGWRCLGNTRRHAEREQGREQETDAEGASRFWSGHFSILGGRLLFGVIP